MTTWTHAYRERRWQILATLFCFLFGLAFIANIQPTGDGQWFWYAVLVRGGQRLYADMHLPLQPLYVLCTVWTQELFGKSWLASKVLALAQLVAYCGALFLIGTHLVWRDWQKAILIIAAFGMTLASIYSRFDDYHIFGYCFEVYAIYAFLRYKEDQSVITATALGVLAGLSVSNRLNDGGALSLACGFVIPFFFTRRRVLSLIAFCCVAPLTLMGVILLTGDSLRDWAMNSIVRAAAIKGGTSNVLSSPLSFPLEMATLVRQSTDYRHSFAVAGLVAIVCVLMQLYGRRSDGRISVWRIALGVSVILLICVHVRRYFLYGGMMEAFATLGVPVAFVLSLWILARLVLALSTSLVKRWDRRELLLLIPILQILGSALSSRGKGVLEVYPQVAISLLLLPISFSLPMRQAWKKTAYLACAGVIAASAFVGKTMYPYHWHHFMDRTLFVERQWYRHPVYGPMYIESDQLEFMTSACAAMSKDGHPTELLSLMNPYPNYFCDVVPWHGYVQTWYDTTSKQTIDTMIGELETAPPKWIIYQRALDSMDAHELIFNGGRPIPHRALDRLIMDRIADGTWEVAGSEKFQGADWILLRTHP